MGAELVTLLPIGPAQAGIQLAVSSGFRLNDEHIPILDRHLGDTENESDYPLPCCYDPHQQTRNSCPELEFPSQAI